MRYGISGQNLAGVTAAESLVGVYLDPTGIFLSFDSEWAKHTEILTYATSGPGGSARTLYVSWMPSKAHSAVQMTEICAGVYDSHLRQVLQGVKAYPGPVVIRFGHEMNIKTAVWSRTSISPLKGTNTEAEFVAAWRYIHDFAGALGIANTRWFWCPNGGDSSPNRAEDYYPGDKYVDIVGFDAYNGYGPWTSFHDTIAPYYERYGAVKPSADIWVGEIGCLENVNAAAGPNSKAQWLSDMFSETAFPRLKCLNYFNTVGGRDWRWESSPAATEAARSGFHAARFAVPLS